jgi:hypothetical protein
LKARKLNREERSTFNFRSTIIFRNTQLRAEIQDRRPAASYFFFPSGFDPARLWPILIVTSTTDFGCTSIKDAPWYRDAAMKEGWVVLAADATISPRADSLQWRLSISTAALQMIRNDWPQSAQWPVAFAGFSGGAKRSGILAAMLADNRGFKICGMFLAGINSDRVTAACKDYHSLKRTGFQHVRLEKFFGGHALKSTEVQRSLHWFRELGKF